jgi:CHAT domain
MIYVGPRRSDALVLTAGSASPYLIELPELNEDAAYQHTDAFLAGRDTALHAPTLGEHHDGQRILCAVLEWLWDTVAEPVLDALGYTATPVPGTPWPRLWWCPIGIMALLPLHAAGYHQAGNHRSVLDRVVSSYTVTVRVLEHARLTPSGPTEAGTPLIVSMPYTPLAPPLHGVRRETTELRRLLPGAVTITGSDATSETVRTALPTHAVAHFACHGVSDWNTPATSQLLLHDHVHCPLTVAAISRLRLRRAELVFLSACSTTQSGGQLIDEAIHLSAAFQIAGYRRVIGTLWPVHDHAATRVAIEFYTYLTGDGRHPIHAADAALALHHVVRQLRGEHPERPTRWAAHIHTGI